VLADLDNAYDCTLQNMLSDILFAYEEHRTKDSYADKPEESEELKVKKFKI
jgi:hypothetical protein